MNKILRKDDENENINIFKIVDIKLLNNLNNFEINNK
jgi:hypothetical protein